MSTATDEEPITEQSATAVLSTRANSSLAASGLIATFGGVGLFLSSNPIQRLMLFGCLAASVVALQWSVRLLSAVLREDAPAAQAWQRLLAKAWQAQLFCLFTAGTSVVLSGLTPPSLPSEASGLLREPLSMKELKKHDAARPLAHLQSNDMDRAEQRRPRLA